MGKLFMPYVMANRQLIEHIKQLSKNGADFIEIGLPFSDPVADGPVIQQAGQRAIKEGTTAEKVLNILAQHRDEIKTPYVLMTYYNLIDHYGVDRFIQDAVKAGVYGFIIPDLPYELGLRFKERLKDTSLKLISLIAMTSSYDRIKMIAEHAEGFIYTVTMNATTGDEKGFHKDLQTKLNMIKAYADVPVVCGFGIRTPEDVKEIIDYCDGIVIGSEIVKRFETSSEEEMDGYLKSIKTALDEAVIQKA